MHGSDPTRAALLTDVAFYRGRIYALSCIGILWTCPLPTGDDVSAAIEAQPVADVSEWFGTQLYKTYLVADEEENRSLVVSRGYEATGDPGRRSLGWWRWMLRG
ncbi:hypothetical protein Droror1_Dr00005369 [Drosera rotundifolia]